MKLKTTAIAILFGIVGSAQAAIVINFNDDKNSGGVNATVADFQVADAALLGTSSLFTINGATAFNNARGAGALTAGGLTISTTGAPLNDGFTSAGHVAGDPILGSNLFDVGANLGLDITGLSSFANGSIIKVTAYGIGDSVNQDTTISATYGAASLSGNTVFNTNLSDSSDAIGTVPYLQFTFTADGTDALGVSLAPGLGGENRSHFNGFSISVVPVPEPSSTALVGLGALGLLARRKR